jgi:hypothetical protein
MNGSVTAVNASGQFREALPGRSPAFVHVVALVTYPSGHSRVTWWCEHALGSDRYDALRLAVHLGPGV